VSDMMIKLQCVQYDDGTVHLNNPAVTLMDVYSLNVHHFTCTSVQ